MPATSSRLVPAIFGAVLVGMPYLLRKQIGMPAVIIAAVLLMFSPTLFYYSRFFRNDRFTRFSDDGFFIGIEAKDPKFNLADARRLLEEAGGRNIEVLED